MTRADAPPLPDPAQHIAELRRMVEYHSHRYYVLDDPDDRGRRVRRAVRSAAGSGGRAPRAAHARLAHAARRRHAGGPPGEGRALGADALALQRPLARRSCARGWSGCATTSRARASSQPRFEYVVEPKVDGLAISPDLPRRRARARRHARGRGDRRGHHPQPAHDPRDSPAHRGRAAAVGGARRAVHVAEGLHLAQRAPRRAGALDLHEPTQLRRRHRPPARPRARRRTAAVDLVLPGGGDRGAVVHHALGGAGVAARARLPGQPRHPTAAQRGRGDRAVPCAGSAAAASSTSRSTASCQGLRPRPRSAASAPSGATRAGRLPGSSRRPPP